MSFPTFERLIQRVILRIGQVPGTGVQNYAEDSIAEMLQTAFDTLFDEWWIPDYCEWTTDLALDGSTGVVTADLSTTIKKYTDIYGVWSGRSDKPMPKLTAQTNPTLISSGSRGRGITPINNTAKVFQVWPRDSTEVVHIFARQRPDSFLDSPTQEVKVDDQLMILRACYDYLEDDGNNPGAADKFLAMFEARYDQINHLLNKGPIILGYTSTTVPESWEER